VHVVAVVQDTPDRVEMTFCVPLRFGVGSIVHLAPVQASASDPPSPLPTALQAVGEVQNTPVRKLSVPLGLGVGSIVHVLPFQVSASVAWMCASV
jgi:hypothetical protein